MPPDPRKVVFPNPFYVLLVIVSTLFLLTVLAYLIGPSVQQQAINQPDAGPGVASRSMTAWLDRNGPQVLAGEFVVMLIAGLLAMALDHKFVKKAERS